MGACCASCAAGKECESDSVGTLRLYNGIPGMRYQGCYPLSDTLPENVVISPGQVRGYLLAAAGMGFPPYVAMRAGDVALRLGSQGYGNMAPDVLAILAAFKVSKQGQAVCGKDPSAIEYVRWLRSASSSGNRAAMMALRFLLEVYRETRLPWLSVASEGTRYRRRGNGIRVAGYKNLIPVNP